MKILLLGEFSAVHKNLKEGLQELGHEIVVASSGDGWKKIQSDIFFGSKKQGVIGALERNLRLVTSLKKLLNFDVVQIMNPLMFSTSLKINYSAIKYIINNNKKAYFLGAGTDTISWKYFRDHHKFKQLYSGARKDNLWLAEYHEKPSSIAEQRILFDMSRGIIPLMYEYAEAHRQAKTRIILPTTPIPVNINEIKYSDNKVKGKLVLFHGVSREGFKGTEIIQNAMNHVRDRYPNDIKIRVEKRLPLEKYLQVIQETNVVIDQAYALSYGVNAVYNMALGKIVIGGGHEECLKEFGISSSPVVSVFPKVEEIEAKIISLLDRRDEFQDMGYASRSYVEEMHDYIKVARRFIRIWNDN